MRFSRNPTSVRVLAAALVAVAAGMLALVSPFPLVAGAAAEVTPVTDLRVAYIGTAHRAIGRIEGVGAEATTPAFFPDGPQHFDDEASARGEVITWVSRRQSRHAQLFVRVGGGDLVRLTRDPDEVAGHPVVSPDGSRVAFELTRAGAGSAHDIWVIGVDGDGLRRVTDGTGDNRWPSWSPDGTELAFAGRRDGSGQQQIYCVTVDGGEIRVITTRPEGAGEPSWNPVAARALIAYTAAPDSTDDRKVHIAASSGADDRLMLVEAWESRQPAWSPDGVTVAFLSRTRQDGTRGTVDLLYSGEPRDDGCPCVAGLRLSQDRLIGNPAWYTPAGGAPQLLISRTSAPDRLTAMLQDVRPDGSDPRDLGLTVLREDPGADRDPALIMNPRDGDPWTPRPSYSPDGRRILVSRFETVNGNRVARLWTAQADGSDAQPMTVAGRADDSQETDATWSPDGTRIAYSRRTPDGAARIVVIDATTGAETARVPGGGSPDTQPAWSPDSGTLAFTRGLTEGGNLTSRIWLARADGTGAHEVSGASCPCGVADYGASFAPDGSQIAFGRSPDGLVTTDPQGQGCAVLVPADASCGQPLTAPQDGTHHPQDTDWSPDGLGLAFSSRRQAPPESPEHVGSYAFADGRLDGLTFEEPGRHKRPVWQRSSDITTRPGGGADGVETGESVTVTISVTDNGPTPAFHIRVPLEVPDGLRVTALEPGAGSCELATVTCDLGGIGVGTTRTIKVTLVADDPGTLTLRWTANGSLADANPADNSASVALVVAAAPSTPPSSAPPPRPADLRLTVTIDPTPTWVGRRTTVVYTLRNVGGQTAAGVRLTPSLPAGIPVTTRPQACDSGGCRVGDVTPGAVRTFRFVLTPHKAIMTTVRGTATPAGGQAVPASAPLRVLQPRIKATPPLGPPGFVTVVRGFDFPPGAEVRLSWDVGLTAAANPAVPAADGTFTAQLLVVPEDELGPRKIQAIGTGFSRVTTDFRVILPAQQPPRLVLRK